MRLNQYNDTTLPYERFKMNNSDHCADCIGTVESKQIFRLSVDRNLYDNFDIYIQYSYINWKNTGFEPANPVLGDILPDIKKYSIGICLQYKY